MAGRVSKVKAIDEQGVAVEVSIADLSRLILIPRGQRGLMPAYTEGLPGKTAYQLAQDAGYTGTLSQWLAAQVGAAGNSVMLRSARVTLTAFALGTTSRDVDVVWTDDTGAVSPFADASYQVMQPAVEASGVAIGAVFASLKTGTKTKDGCTLTVRTTGIAIAAGQVVTVAAIR